MNLQAILNMGEVSKHTLALDNTLTAEYKPPRPRIVCMDGTTLSVQASAFTYCTPRDNVGPYTAVEVGYPSRKFEQLMPWAEDPSDPTGTIYGFVPVEVVNEVIASCGGICVELTMMQEGVR